MALAVIDDKTAGATTLPRVLKAIRRRRGLSAAQVAQAMNMPLRSYQHFESGRGRLNPDRIHQFAKAVDADGHAILVALHIGSTAFAVRCVDNKLMTILVMGVREFNDRSRDDLSRLDPHTLVSAFTQLFESLSLKAREVEAYLERWMTDHALHGPPDPED